MIETNIGSGLRQPFEFCSALCFLPPVIGAPTRGETGMRCGIIPTPLLPPHLYADICDPDATGPGQVREGGPRDDREPGDRPMTGHLLVRRWVGGREFDGRAVSSGRMCSYCCV